MKLPSFHHPDYCPKVMRRHAVDEVLDLMVGGLEMSSRRGSQLWRAIHESDSAYHSAVSRLRKRGLIARRGGEGKAPVFALTEEGACRVSDVCRRREPWPSKWNGIWYQLAYDVPETDRRYRTVLRGFLKRMRMGCLQKSVWVTPRDIRPEYADLVETSAVDLYSFLFEAQTVLGRSAQDVVRQAWNMERLKDAQGWYMHAYQAHLDRAEAGDLNKERMALLLREELSAYLTVMQQDPLLPRPLWPKGYQGKAAWRFHRRFARALSRLI